MKTKTDKIFDHIDEMYEVISNHNYDYEKSRSELFNLLKIVEDEELDKDFSYYQLIGTLEYFICKSTVKNAPYKCLLLKNEKLEKYFNASLALDKNNPPLQYLYGLYLYEIGDFVNAKYEFSKINIQYFEELEIFERIFKIEEMIICCKIFLKEACEYNIINFIKEIEKTEDRFYPTDLIETLKYNEDYFTGKIRSELEIIKKEPKTLDSSL
ncbi:hypothetical protein SAMN05443633_12015 [Chryseobacterium arachidis]|uniref:Tetratricopeptide repeat-containing protein n=1 Tax=Chryseobacterium arachidis TaxID=1416778 RepID=A0A1M5LU25_9FLAO|nr:hypothetical protein [Chryseobacterium arachidis]SHG67893.1 hypothetical protein SAMN05443633_12015 [Chryseobacterium arachidis]